jgi:ATP-dependent DNA ligase
MTLPVPAPLEPMLAKLTAELPAGDGWLYEPKWDGFRALVFRDGDELFIQSRDLKPFNRYFPELEQPLREALPARCVVDGEIVIASAAGLDFEMMLQRIHPAASRVKMLAEKFPASMVLWDLLALDDASLLGTPMEQRRGELERVLTPNRSVRLTPITRDRDVAKGWLARFEGAGLDGVMAKPASGVYEPGKRTGMFKVKHSRTCDCVVAGFRWHKNGRGTLLGSLLLGLYDDEGVLQHVGVAASFTAKERKALIEELAPLRENASEGHPWQSWAEAMESEEFQRKPGATSRWNAKKDLSWEPLRVERVVEVSYDHMQGTRFRHTAHVERWRPDKRPSDCTYAQLEVTPPMELKEIFGLSDRDVE